MTKYEVDLNLEIINYIYIYMDLKSFLISRELDKNLLKNVLNVNVNKYYWFLILLEIKRWRNDRSYVERNILYCYRYFKFILEINKYVEN